MREALLRLSQTERDPKTHCGHSTCQHAHLLHVRVLPIVRRPSRVQFLADDLQLVLVQTVGRTGQVNRHVPGVAHDKWGREGGNVVNKLNYQNK